MDKDKHKPQLILFFLLASVVVLLLPINNLIKNGWSTNTKDLFLADDFESYVNLLRYNLLNQSNQADKVIAGKNGFLFLGNEYGRMLYKMRNIYPYSQKQIDMWAQQMGELQQHYQQMDVDFSLIMVPNKHSVYSEHLPDWVPIKRPYITDHLSYLAKQSDLKFLDLRPTFTQAKADNPMLYWKKDSHWNFTGAALGVNAILEFVNDTSDLSLTMPDIKFTEKSEAGFGLARLLKIDHLIDLGPAGLQFDMPLVSGFCHGRIDPKTMELLPCEPSHNGYLNIHKGPQYFINDQALNPQKVLLLCDSFSMQSIRLYQETFETVWAHHYNRVSKEDLDRFIAINKPDLVIYQMVERAVFTPKFLNIK